ncbi:MAG: DUF1186 domain-containing protein [Leptolyngbyaceae cyanobacterium MO_188.B28]|nr:DUF1186 domain-containing protein [Leptolyngbyaceae cyanobacterium MO_188.B28]
MELDEILSALEENTSRKFPRLAVEAAIAQQEAITPLLLKALEDAKANIEEIQKRPDYFLVIYALHLLAQFRETKAYPLIVDFFSIPGRITQDVTGDLITEDLPRILASVQDGDLNPIKGLIENIEVNEYVRGSALRSLLVLAAQGVIPREQVCQYCQDLFPKFERDGSFWWTDLVIYSARLCPTDELLKLIEEAFEEELVDEFFVGRGDIEYYRKLGPEGALQALRENRHYTFVEDVVAEMERWACFREEKPKSTTKISMPKSRSAPTMQELGMAPQSFKSKEQKKKKRQAQKQSRKKNRPKKK